jgi:hypothetical protein
MYGRDVHSGATTVTAAAVNATIYVSESGLKPVGNTCRKNDPKYEVV